MVLARNTYRFALLLVGYGIASGLDDLGAYDAELFASLGLAIGSLALLGGTVAHVSEGSGDSAASSDSDSPDGRDDGDDSAKDDEMGDDQSVEPPPNPRPPRGWY